MKVNVTLNFIHETDTEIKKLPVEVALITQDELEVLDFVEIEVLQNKQPLLVLATKPILSLSITPLENTYIFFYSERGEVNSFIFEEGNQIEDENNIQTLTRTTFKTDLTGDVYFLFVNEFQYEITPLKKFCSLFGTSLGNLRVELDQDSLREGLS